MSCHGSHFSTKHNRTHCWSALFTGCYKLFNWGYAKFLHGDGIQIEIYTKGVTESKNNRNQKGNHETHFVFHSDNVQSSKISACEMRAPI